MPIIGSIDVDVVTANVVRLTPEQILSLHACLERDLPPIALVDTATAQLSYWHEATAHAVVVVGIEDDLIHINDPAFQDAPKSSPSASSHWRRLISTSSMQSFS